MSSMARGLISDVSILSWVGISGTTAKSRKRKFVPFSHLGPFVCNIVVSIHFKYTLAGRQDLILTSVAHLCKRLS